MNCPNCNTRGNVTDSEVRSSGWRYRRWRCPACDHRWEQRTTPDDVLPRRGGRVGLMSDAQIEWVLTTTHTGKHCAQVLGCSENLILKIRRRIIYRHVRPDLGRWRSQQPGLTDAPAPTGMTVAASLVRHANRNRNCIECQHFGGLPVICALGHAAVKVAGMKAAVECDDYQELDDDDEPELEAAG